MGRLAIVEDILDIEHASFVQYSGPLIEYIQERWPDGFNDRHVRVFLNDKELEVADFDSEICEDDVCTILMVPADPVTAALITAGVSAANAAVITSVLTQIALALASAVISRLFAPKPKSRVGAKAVYQIGGEQNQLALGDVVPEHFGTCWFYPTYISQPYSKFIDGNQYLYSLMLIGAGQHRIDDLRAGTSRLDSFPNDTIEHWIFQPADHASKLGHIESVTGIHEDVITSFEVQDIDFGRDANSSFFGRSYAGDNRYDGKEANPEFKVGDTVLVLGENPSMKNHNVTSTVTVIDQDNIRLAAPVINDGGNPWYQLVKNDDGWRGWFDCCAPGKQVNKLEFDFVFPNGLFTTDEEGDYKRNDAFIIVEVQMIDDLGNTIGQAISYNYSYNGRSANPKRVTESVSVSAGRYRARAKRDDRDDAKSNQNSRVFWAGLKGYAVNPSGAFAYGDITILAVKMKATRALSEASASKVTCKATRILPTVVSNFTSMAATKEPSDAFAHVVRSGSDAVDGLDMANLLSRYTEWQGTNGFNFRFDEASTVYEALQIIAAGHRATPTAYSKQIGMRPDRAQSYDKFLVTNQQMIEGTYSVGFKLGQDEIIDSYRVEYHDPLTASKLYVLWPFEGANPEAVNLYGCTDKATALQHAKYLWEKRQGIRRSAQFDTEFDAHCFSVGDRIGVMHPLVDWTISLRVLEVSGLELTLDGLPENQGAIKAMLRSDTGQPSPVIDAVLTGNKLTLSRPAPFAIHSPFTGQESTTVVLGYDSGFRRSYVVTELSPSESGVSVKVVGYDGTEYTHAIPGEVIS